MLDINAEMLEEGKKRFIKTMYHDGAVKIGAIYESFLLTVA